jgi:hypothetical protein
MDALRVLFYYRLFEAKSKRLLLISMVEHVMKGLRANIGVFSFSSRLAVVLHTYIDFVW